MGAFSPLSSTNPWHQSHLRDNPTLQNQSFPSATFLPPLPRMPTPFSCFALDSSRDNAPPLVVVGSANADIYVEIDRLPKEGETVSARTGQTLAGGKGANQAVCGGRLAYPTYFVGQVGDDAHGRLITEALGGGGVVLDRLTTVAGAPTGHAVVMLQSDGQNSIIIVGGANMAGWPESLPPEDLEVVKNAGIVLLQREIPDSVNIQVAKVAHSSGVPVILDAGGVDAPIPPELLKFVDILSPNETELARLTNMPTENFEQISQAVGKCHKMPRYSWYPRMQGFLMEISLYQRTSIIPTVVNTLRRIDRDNLLQQFLNESPFGHILLINKRRNSNAALHELLAWELYDGTLSEFERWFHVGSRDIRFGPQEICLVMGLHFWPSTFNPNGLNHVIPPTSLFHTNYKGNAIKVKRLLNDFKTWNVQLGSMDQYLSAANLLMYYFMILCRDKRPVDDWAWTLVEDRERWDSFPWGSWAFQIMCQCYQLGVAKKDPIEIGG